MEDKFLDLQQQMRHNQEDLKDFLRDLDNWEDTIKEKDIELQTGSSTKQQKLPPVRNKVKEKPKRKKDQSKAATNTKEEADSSSVKQQRIKAYDYRKWDTFDVEKACAEVESGGEENRVSSEYETDSDEERKENARQQKMMQANMEKEKGNDFFKKGQFDEAVLCYTRGMEADNTNAILPANRAMALLKLKRFEEAESDCSLALSLDCTYVKAVCRRASARLGLGKLSEAKQDFEQVLLLEPSNKLAKTELKKIGKLEKDEEDKHNSAPTNRIYAVDKPPHLRSKKPLKRIHIEEIGTNKEENIDIESTAMETKDDQQKVPKETEISTDTETHEKRVNADTSEKSQLDKTKTASEVVTADVPVITPPPSVPPSPQSSYHLLADWKRLEKYPTQLVQYFKQINPETYPSLFKQSMDSDVLSKILILLHNHYIPSNEAMFAVISNLTKVKRFDMNVMFMSSEEKKLVKNILEHISKNENINEAVLRDVSRKYGI
ncbi:RNA polymerase II-associated protein 3-like [Antedon mediterranea]|uniref:RNA polymerase II-associated protein 3-like n=1 Tax=Antedon mediterranea TaxID=105859 RepID=UPI003AF58779